MIAPARQHELSLVAAKICGIIISETEQDGETYDGDEAARIIASIMVNLARSSDGPEFDPAAPFIRAVQQHIANMAVAVTQQDFEIITNAEVNQ